ncbi:hypothetical protein KP509_12G073800 [Ceratopteris richardii]|uniref:Secreted protein n=1 Tax=Ceratopteris richardii TaxID=49495 RepID=A0A8T2TQ00_CERRI|nr:hypothetical protein KP509_12G073800 [Ceratopteris richardii]
MHSKLNIYYSVIFLAFMFSLSLPSAKPFIHLQNVLTFACFIQWPVRGDRRYLILCWQDVIKFTDPRFKPRHQFLANDSDAIINPLFSA